MKIRKAFDGFISALSGLGGARDKTKQLQFHAEPLTQEVLALLWEHDWLAKRISSTLPHEAFKKKLVANEDDLAWFDSINRNDTYPNVFETALTWGRHYGACAILIGTEGAGDTSRPLTKGPHEIRWLDIVHARELKVLAHEQDPTLADYGKPSLYEIQRPHLRMGVKVHDSRLIWCGGDLRAKPDPKVAGGYWHSILDAIWETISRYDLNWTAVTHLLHESSIATLKMRGLISMLGSADQDLIDRRMDIFNSGKSVAKTVFLDEGESFERTSAHFGGLGEVMSELILSVCGAAGIPATVLFGRSPAGMNATGESDLRIFENAIAVYQQTNVLSKLARIFAIAGKDPPAFQTVRSLTEQEESAIYLQRAQANEILVRSEILYPEEVTLLEAERLGLNDATIRQAEKRLKKVYENSEPADPEAAEHPPESGRTIG